MPKGSLFLTVTVHNDDEITDHKQLFRVDIPMTYSRLDKITQAHLEELGYYTTDVTAATSTTTATTAATTMMDSNGYSSRCSNGTGGSGADIDPNSFQSISSNLRLAVFNVANPYILIPACSTCIQVKLTISQVSVWPKAVVLGQTVQDLRHFLFWKQSVGWHQVCNDVWCNPDIIFSVPITGNFSNK
jgi:hypothetical protein